MVSVAIPPIGLPPLCRYLLFASGLAASIESAVERDKTLEPFRFRAAVRHRPKHGAAGGPTPGRSGQDFDLLYKLEGIGFAVVHLRLGESRADHEIVCLFPARVSHVEHAKRTGCAAGHRPD